MSKEQTPITAEIKIEYGLGRSQFVILTNSKGDTYTSRSEELIDFLSGCKEMKEQTPITAEEFYYKWQTQDFEPKKIQMPNFTEEELLNFGEQYAQAKVLEALEREFSKLDYVPVMDGEMAGINYYETEVKPKYKL